MNFSIVRGHGRRWATIAALAVIAGMHGWPVLAAYGVPGGPRAPSTGDRGILPVVDAPRIGSERAAAPAERKQYAQLAKIFDFTFLDDRPSRDEEDRALSQTYRTVCVRLCDGYYFPVSYATSRARFAQDARVCESRCGGAARLFVYRNPGSDVEDMADLKGEPYRSLPTAFLYRTQYVPSCKCQPHPWEAEARQRHETYALASAARRGDKVAARKLKILQRSSAVVSKPSVGDGRTVGTGRDQRKRARRAGPARMAGSANSDSSEASMMRLGTRAERGASRARTGSADSDWRKRVFQGN